MTDPKTRPAERERSAGRAFCCTFRDRDTWGERRLRQVSACTGSQEGTEDESDGRSEGSLPEAGTPEGAKPCRGNRQSPCRSYILAGLLQGAPGSFSCYPIACCCSNESEAEVDNPQRRISQIVIYE